MEKHKLLSRKEFEKNKNKLLTSPLIYKNGWWVEGQFSIIGSIVETVSKAIEYVYYCLQCRRVWAPPVIQSSGCEEYFDNVTSYGKKGNCAATAERLSL